MAALWILGTYCETDAAVLSVLRLIKASLGELPIVESEMRLLEGEEPINEDTSEKKVGPSTFLAFLEFFSRFQPLRGLLSECAEATGYRRWNLCDTVGTFCLVKSCQQGEASLEVHFEILLECVSLIAAAADSHYQAVSSGWRFLPWCLPCNGAQQTC